MSAAPPPIPPVDLTHDPHGRPGWRRHPAWVVVTVLACVLAAGLLGEHLGRRHAPAAVAGCKEAR